MTGKPGYTPGNIYGSSDLYTALRRVITNMPAPDTVVVAHLHLEVDKVPHLRVEMCCLNNQPGLPVVQESVQEFCVIPKAQYDDFVAWTARRVMEGPQYKRLPVLVGFDHSRCIGSLLIDASKVDIVSQHLAFGYLAPLEDGSGPLTLESVGLVADADGYRTNPQRQEPYSAANPVPESGL